MTVTSISANPDQAPPPPEATELRMNGAEFIDLIQPVIVHAATRPESREKPELGLVGIEVTADGVLYLHATDRYTLAVRRYDLTDGAPAQTLKGSVCADHLAAALRAFDAEDELTLTFTDQHLTVEVITPGWHPASSVRLPMQPYPDTPAWRELLAPHVMGPSVNRPITLDPANVARFTGPLGGGQGEPVELRHHDGVTLVARGSRLLGAIAQIRRDDPLLDLFGPWALDIDPTLDTDCEDC